MTRIATRTSIEVRHHNAITNARYEYSELQLDIFIYLLSQLRKGQSDGIYRVSVPGMSDLTGKQYNYKHLRESTADMGSRCFEIETEHNGRTVWRQMWMFKRIDYIQNTGLIEVEFNETIMPYLFDLKQEFTSIELYSFLRLSSKHAKRIYSMCSQWRDVGQTRKMDILDFKRMIGLLDDRNEGYTEISMFRKKVLDVAINQISERTNFEVGYKLEKEGRTFKNICFTVKQRPLAIALPISEESTGTFETPAGITDGQAQNARLVLEKLAIKDARLVSQILASSDLIRQVNKFAYDLQSGSLKADKNPGGLLLTMLGLKTKKLPA